MFTGSLLDSCTDRSHQDAYADRKLRCCAIVGRGKACFCGRRPPGLLPWVWYHCYERSERFIVFVSLIAYVFLKIPFTSIQFPLYELLKLRLSKVVNRKPLYAHEAAVCGSIAGGVAAALTTPLDVLKTRVMLDLRVGAFNFPAISLAEQAVELGRTTALTSG